MERIVIIGCGYLGSHLANHFSIKHWQVKVLGRNSVYSSMLDPNVQFIDININDVEQVQEEIEEGDVVLYAAGSTNATNLFEDVLVDVQQYYVSFIKLINSCCEKKIKKFVFLSSAGTVYKNTGAKSSEDDCLEPSNIYGLQKVFFENLIKIKHLESNDFPYLILRVSNPYGGFQNPYKKQGIIPVLINKALNDEEFIFWGDTRAVRDFIFINDFLEATYNTVMLLDQEIINIGSGNATTISEVISLVERRTEKNINIVYKSSGQKTIMKNIIDITKLNRLTGFLPSTSLEEGIVSTINQMRRKIFDN
ncbi:NAD-dependent epimerase/dehydratase family protein [Paenibacillus jiagnxiensis]|uniref:NAD-dependent epimerase/dehydratase family protein n=1 Tax=Paenibacillus jiagnxiensis TaxID=3228926 RepID=UPI0033B3F943